MLPRSHLAPALGALALLLLPATASAATATAHVHGGGEQGPRGTVMFRAAPGERNRLTVSDRGGITFHDAAVPVHARGGCERVDAHTARCPFSEDEATAWLGDRDDRVSTHGDPFVLVLGGPGDDVLGGSIGTDELRGDEGDDVLRGGAHDDELTGGPGRDRVYGGSGDDELIDGETDREAAPDLYRGGTSRDTRDADYGDVVDYGLRHRALRIDLGRHRSNTGDRILGLESIAGGHGDDRLTGDGDDNELLGGPGDDVLRGRAGRDTMLGGSGADRLAGDGDRDVLWGNTGLDRLSGGADDDLLESRDHRAEAVTCGGGEDHVVGNRSDRLAASCDVAVEQTYSRTLSVRVHPSVADDTATFRVACVVDGGGSSCDGTIALAGPDGTDYGSGTFTGLPSDPETFSDVTVALTPAGAAAVRAGTVVQVAYGSHGGYRTYLRAG